MLTSIPMFAKVMQPNVGPRFAAYETYSRAGVSVRVGPTTPIFLQPPRAYAAQALVTAKIRQPLGYATAFAYLIGDAPSIYAPRSDGRSTQTTASASVLGVAPSTQFGYVL